MSTQKSLKLRNPVQVYQKFYINRTPYGTLEPVVVLTPKKMGIGLERKLPLYKVTFTSQDVLKAIPKKVS